MLLYSNRLLQSGKTILIGNSLYAANESTDTIHGSSRANAASMIKSTEFNQKCALYPRKRGIMA